MGIEKIMGINVNEQKILCNRKSSIDSILINSIQLIIMLERGAKGKKKKATTETVKKKHREKLLD